MKKITFLISVLVILAVGVKAQDVGVSDILTPAGDTTIAVGSSLPLTVVLTNYGPASVVEGTTVTMAMYIDGTNAGGGTVTVPAGMTIAANESVMMPFNPIDLSTLPAGTYEFCVGTDGTSLGADPVATNNKHCFQLTVGTASYALSNYFGHTVLEICEFGGIETIIKQNVGLRKGVYLYKGALTNQALGEMYNIPYQDIDLITASWL